MKNIAVFFLLLNIWPANRCTAQDIREIETKLETYLLNNFQEKLYMHTDKSSYLAGERIWFKVYCAEAYTNRPVDVSKVAYIELLDNTNKPVLQSRVALKDSGGEGSLYTPLDLSSGLYTIRCYTSWMKNFDPDYYFHKNIVIYNTLREESSLANEIKTKNSRHIQFFPEGGNLVAGLTSRVAFRAVDSQGESFNFEAALVNSRKDTVLKFGPFGSELGSFYFKPENHETYNVWIKPVGGQGFNASLPQIFEKGVVMLTSESGAGLSLSVQSTLDTPGKLTLFVHCGQKTILVDSLDPGNQRKGFQVPLNLLGDGISHFTLFNANGEALCERLYFKKPQNLLNVRINTDKPIYSTREKVQLEISTTFKSVPPKSNFSVSVYSADSLLTSDEDIAVSLWLTSELKGRIENAAWYFNDAPADATDLLMLTHGWRRFKWEDVLKERKAPVTYLPEVDGHIISGRVVNPISSTGLSNRTGFLSIPGVQGKLYTASSNEDGDIHFYTSDFYGGNEIITQPDLRTDSTAAIEISSPYSSLFAAKRVKKYNLFPNPNNLLKRSVAMQVNNAWHSKYLNNKTVINADAPFFYVRPEKVYVLDSYVRFTTMEEVLREYVPEINVTIRKNSYHLRMLDSETGKYHENDPLVLIDGVPIFDEGNSVIRMDPLKIQRLEIVTSAYQYGKSTFPGILSIHSYSGQLAGYALPSRALAFDYDGLQLKREFYSPMYEKDSTVLSRTPDYRTTLFWSANNKTSSAGTSELSFFTSDLDGKYIIEIQALSDDGKAGSARAIINVVKKLN
ncbi:TonB-dependent receptor-like protein [Arcticibacter tournemirensis]|uniref:Plug domain-containing protein n=1 Tax=Arcticibacter tournemirensis TaxID=699437 RepID=A0A5M9HC27_9SPHI|nr:Plug domain-containing protein [Arcticibacter tournemirensis]KAA8482457.1 Plug domain-containing protein [Arcticibacter tournemirensis]TQM51655.1 TonB-dependent receptor-like protein [Arcticibacter tournemirensis]